MFYVHQINCLSPQQSYFNQGTGNLNLPVHNILTVVEPTYADIPKNSLRRMCKMVRMGIGAALPLIKQCNNLNGVITASGNGGMEDSIIFLQQIIDYNEGLLTPSHFVQSTANALAGQISLLGLNRGYNITHMHRGLAFEMAAIDAAMLLQENTGHSYLLGGVDEISAHNHKLDFNAGWYKKEHVAGLGLYNSQTPGTIAGEGAVMMEVNNNKINAIARLTAVSTLHSQDAVAVQQFIYHFLAQHTDTGIDLFLSGENGDSRFLPFYINTQEIVGDKVCTARFKHLCGEYPTASSFAVWVACQVVGGMPLPQNMVKKGPVKSRYSNILIYNCHQGFQHSLLLVSNAG